MTAALAAAMKDLAPFCSTDPARVRMVAPFGCEIGGVWYLVATNGHTAAGVRLAEAEGVVVPNAPPLAGVLDGAGTDVLGSFCEEALYGARKLPRTWDAGLRLGRKPGETAALTADHVSGKVNPKRTRIFDDVSCGWPLALDTTEPVGITVGYLIDAFDFIGMKAVTVRGRRIDPLAPFVFSDAQPWREAPRFAIVMPRRV